MSKQTLLDAVLNADSKELEVIDAKIAELDETIKTLNGDRAKLVSLRKTIDILVNGKPERKKREAKTKAVKPSAFPGQPSGTAEDRRKRIAEHIDKHGPTRVAELAIVLKEEAPNVHFAVSNGYFTKTERGIVLTPEGRQRYLEA